MWMSICSTSICWILPNFNNISFYYIQSEIYFKLPYEFYFEPWVFIIELLNFQLVVLYISFWLLCFNIMHMFNIYSNKVYNSEVFFFFYYIHKVCHQHANSRAFSTPSKESPYSLAFIFHHPLPLDSGT